MFPKEVTSDKYAKSEADVGRKRGIMLLAVSAVNTAARVVYLSVLVPFTPPSQKGASVTTITTRNASERHPTLALVASWSASREASFLFSVSSQPSAVALKYVEVALSKSL